MAHIQENIMKLCSNLNNFRVAEKYTDVTIRCEDENFKCHRNILASASDFFDTMFSGRFRESAEESIFLPKTNAQTFKDVLQFIYTGDVIISHENIVSIWEASDFFVLPGMAELCSQFIMKNKMNVRNTVDSYTFALKTNQQTLIDTLSRDIAEQMEIFSFVSCFLDLSFDEFIIIVNIYKSLSIENDASLISVILRWIFHCPESRKQYFNRFLGMIENLNEVKYEIMDFIAQLDSPPASSHTSHLVSQSDACALIHQLPIKRVQDLDYDFDISEGLRGTVIESNVVKAEKSLHIYVKYTEEKLMRVFAIKDLCSYVSEIPINRPDQWMKIVALNENLFSFAYIRRNPTEASTYSQSFYMNRSADMSSIVSLKPPPVIFDDVSMCSFNSKNDIYVYNQTLSQRIPTMNSSNLSFFGDEEVSRGIYVYNCEVNRWFPVPTMKEKLEDACMTICDNVLYLVGGSVPNTGAPTKFTQAYDYRIGKWSLLQNTNDYFIGADCCVRASGDLFVSGGKVTRNIESYDPKMGRWVSYNPSTLFSLPTLMIHHKSHWYGTSLWMMGGYTKDTHSEEILNDLSLYHSLGGLFKYSSILTESSARQNKNEFGGTVLDSIVFMSSS